MNRLKHALFASAVAQSTSVEAARGLVGRTLEVRHRAGRLDWRVKNVKLGAPSALVSYCPVDAQRGLLIVDGPAALRDFVKSWA